MANTSLTQLWPYLATTSILWMAITLICYMAACRLYKYANNNPLLNPVISTIFVLMLILTCSNISYSAYFNGVQLIHFLLGPATVALAIPLHQQFHKLQKILIPASLSIFIGCIIASISAIGIGWAFDASNETLLSLAPKSVTTPVAMSISQSIGGIPSLTASFVVITGIIGAICGAKIFDLLRIDDDSIKGIAMGVSAHGIGTAKAIQTSPEMGAFSGLAMAISALFLALILPWLLSVFEFITL